MCCLCVKLCSSDSFWEVSYCTRMTDKWFISYRPLHLVLQILVDPLKSCIATLDPKRIEREGVLKCKLRRVMTESANTVHKPKKIKSISSL